jgi:ligand-binding sensor domain-containing protein/serine phosphatase RsbU (regulator of sigma subunit)
LKIRYIKIWLINLMLLSGSFSFSQNFRFIEYDAENGLCDNFIYNIIQDDNGYLWLGTGEGLCRFDGFNFTHEFLGDSIPKSPVKKSFKDSRGRLWFGFDNGDIALLENLHFRLFSPDEQNRSTINGFTEDSKGNIIVATQDKGLIRISPDNTFTILTDGLEGQLVSSILLTSDNDCLIGTFDGLFLYRFDTNSIKISLIGRLEDIPYTNVQTISAGKEKNVYWVGTADEGAFKLKKLGDELLSYKVTKLSDKPEFSYSDIHDVFEDEENNLWLSTGGQGVFKFNYSGHDSEYTSFSNYNEKNGLSSPYIYDIYEDIEGNYWFASYGAGISVLRDQSFLFYEFEDLNFGSNVLSLVQVGDNYWLGGETGIMITDINGNRKEYLGTAAGIPDDKITSLYYDGISSVWAGTSRNGIYKFNVKTKKANRYFVSNNSLENTINDLIGIKDTIWSATNGGIFEFDLIKGTYESTTTTEGLPHNKVRDLYLDNSGNIWVATRSNGLYNYTAKKELKIDGGAELEFISVTQDQAGNLWAITNGDGVFEFSSDSLRYFSTNDGLRSNYCYSIDTDSKGNIWIGHRLGMSRIDRDSRNIQSFSVEQGISADCNLNAVLNNKNNNLVFGTSKGLIEYVPSQDKIDSIPPKLNITSLIISDKPYEVDKPVLLDYGIYKIQINFIGINLKNPDKVTYQLKLDGYDDWSEPTNIPYENYIRVDDGNYTFMLKACDESGICTETPLTLDIQISMPFWKRWWFILLSLIFLFSVVFVIIKIRERNQKQIQEYLQRSLDERTKEVMEQKEEIENKNRDITDSINYAQRIQASILPPIKKLHDTFAGSFVFYQPRDIVSGDFYWYDRVWGNKFVIVCADSTGHGVPGAFMSMIGTTLIKDICNRPEVRSPAEILKTLDQEIQDALNQNVEAEKSNDGMDIIVAEIDIEKRYLRIASAMRPLILYIDGQQVYVKGSRNSVGGRFDEDSDEKVFENEGFQMNKGDIIYMFSDGYPDQFGGPLGKKFKMVRLKNLIRDIHDKPMEEQYNYVKSNFMLWKEDLEQVDDVLFMGIKF